MKSMFRVYLLLIAFVMGTLAGYSQVTTSGMNGKITGANNETLPGATVVAVHQPSGTQYGTITNAEGRFAIQGMRSGGPYKVEVSFVGYNKATYSDITIALGENFALNANLKEESVDVAEVVVIGTKSAAFDAQKTGAAMNVDNKQITSLPTISRSINDFTRMVPQSNGLSFGGRDGRYNYITIDGAAFNNSFGLSGSTRNLPGGDAQPISLDAIDQISVSIAPYDVRQSNFTGASINAVTKSGDNTFKGSAYTYLRPSSFAGKEIDGTKYTWDEKSGKTYGVSLGGPIIKDKLFFFVNGEYEKSEYPSTSWKVSADGTSDAANYISRTKESDLSTLKDYLISNYNYNPGSWNWGQFASENYKGLARIDWNINKSNKLSVRYNQVVSTNDVLTNATSSPGGSFNNGRISEKAMAFTNAGYGFENTVRSITGELNSTFGARFSNKLLATYTQVRDKRTSDSDLFPFVDILNGTDFYTSFGYELYTYNNDVKNNTFSVIDNFSAFLGNHTVTAGVSYEQMYFGNAYMRFGSSYYRYASMDDFLTNKAPSMYAITYGLNGNDSPFGELSFGMGGVYLQDEWQATDNFKLTGGVRLEMPFYLNDLQPNQAIADMNFINDQKMDVSQWPDQQLMVSPRLGFNWNVLGDNTFKVRGGTGIFTGRLPFVWFVNQPTNAGVLQYTKILSGTAVPADMKFNPNIKGQIEAYPNLFPANPVEAPSDLAVVKKDFKMPQVWRSNLAFDVALPASMVFTMEGIYTKDINAIVQTNINEKAPTLKFEGSDNRPRYEYLTASKSFDNRVNPKTSSAMVLDNTDKGYQYSITAQLVKKFSYGITGMVAYTFSEAKDVTANPGDQAASAWRSNVAVGSLNDPGLSYSNFSVPHRVIGNVSYTVNYLRNLATTFSLFYQGSAQGRLNYMYSNDMNGDGQSSDLMYIPKDANDIIFKDLGAGMSPQEQSDAFFKFVEQDDYLSSHKGQYAERYGAVTPWRNQFDFKAMQDIIYDRKSGRRLQVSLDIKNLGNLLNSSWGLYKSQITGSYDNLPLLKYEGVEAATGKPMFSLPVKAATSYYTNTYKDVLSYSSTWSMQLGVRLTF
jgi:outer membrane receptor protein involved in Fe transport